MSSFEELMKQVESLKKENSNLRRELQDNSSHLTKLETEAGNMKDVLTHLHSAMQDDDQGNISNNTGEMNSFNGSNNENDTSQPAVNTDNVLDHNSNESGDETLQDKGWSHMQAVVNNQQQQQQQQQQPLTSQQSKQKLQKQQLDELNTLRNQQTSISTNNTNPITTTSTTDPNLNTLVETPDTEQPEDINVTVNDIEALGRALGIGVGVVGETGIIGSANSSQKSSHASSPIEAPTKKRSGDKEVYTYIQDLDKKRKALLQDIENEERERKWYCDQVDELKRQVEDLPVTEQYNLQTDMNRRQLDYEMQRLRDRMKESIGTSEDIAQRHEARLQRIHMIESEMIRVQQIHKEQIISGSDLTSFNYQDVRVDRTTGTPLNTQNILESPLATTHPLGTDTANNGGRLITIATQTAENCSGGAAVVAVPPAQGIEEGTGVGYGGNQNLSALYHGSWPLDRDGQNEVSLSTIANQETVSVMSFHTNNTSSTRHSGGGGYIGGNGGSLAAYGQQQTQPHPQHLGTKVEMVYGLLSMLGTHDKEDMSRTLLAMSSSQDSCIAMRQSGCLPLLIQLLHGSDSENGLLGKTRGSKAARARAAAALHNVVHSHPDDKRGRREARVLRLLEQIRAHCDQLRDVRECVEGEDQPLLDSKADMDHHPGPAIAALMKLSFDEEHRHAICTLGGLQAIAELLQVDHEINGNTTEQYNITMRRYACMALTNLTFGDGTNKALLCSLKPSMKGLVAQLHSSNEDLRQVAASVLRNLSWRADLASKKILREVGSVTALTRAAMDVQKESTMKSVLSALWNLSAHCSENKADVCLVEGALAFLVATLMYKSPSKTLSIIENGGGILRNISSHIAIREEYRLVLRQHGCLQILLKHLRSPSLTIVSNACGTLWNLSARCAEDQKALWELGAVSMLKNLVNSKHKMISMGSAAALKNLLNARPTLGLENDIMFGSSNKPGLHIRKQRALEAEIDPNLSETCENMESPTDSPTHTSKRHDQRNNKMPYNMYSADGIQQMYGQGSLTMNVMYNHHRMTASDMSPFVGHQVQPNPGFTRPVSRSGSQDSVGSVHSDISHDRTRQMLIKSSKLLEARTTNSFDAGRVYSPRHHRNNIMSKSHDSHSYRSRSGSADRSNHPVEHPNRIMQMMKEVAKHSGLDTSGRNGHHHMLRDATTSHHQYSLKESHSADNTPQVSRRSQAQNASFHEMPIKHKASRLPHGVGNNNITGSGSYPSSSTNETHNKSSHSNSSQHMDVSHLSRNMEKLHLMGEEDQGEDERPIDFSKKYTDTDSQIHTNTGPTPFSGAYSAFRPNTQVNNYVSDNSGKGNNSKQDNSINNKTSSVQRSSVGNSSNVNTHSQSNASSRHQKQQQQQNLQSKSSSSSNSKSWISGNITDNHPNDRFNSLYEDENERSGSNEDQPIDYSSRYNSEKDTGTGHPHTVKTTVPVTTTASSQGLPHYEQHLSSMDDDQVIPFCTEGTPLNFLSTATSLTDLSKINEHDDGSKSGKDDLDLDASRDEVTDFASRNAEHDENQTESLPSDRNTSSTVVAAHNLQNEDNNKNDSPKSSLGGVSKGSGVHSQVPSLYSYNDHSSMSASPSEKPVKYCTEGTPCSFSRRSSLSSLQDSETNESSHSSNKQDLTLQAIDENDSLDTSHNITLKADSGNSALYHHHQVKANTSGNSDGGHSSHTKTVTFDNNVQETPLMFSRCSSLGSLSSFDAHSVHSSVMSDYSTSRRTSGMVSPSELPDSPSDTMPPTPKARRSPPPVMQAYTPPGKPTVATTMATTTISNRNPIIPNVRDDRIADKNDEHNKFNNSQVGQNNNGQSKEATIENVQPQIPAVILTPQFPYTSNEIVKKYAVEGSPQDSCATSLSRLTFEDEPVIEKDPTLKRIPLGIDDGKSDKTGSTQSPINEKLDSLENEENKENNKFNDSELFDEDDGNDSPVSESEENMLAECISLAMPSATSTATKKKMKKSASDNTIKDNRSNGHVSASASGSRLPTVSNIPRSNTTPKQLNMSATTVPTTTSIANRVNSNVPKHGSGIPLHNTAKGSTKPSQSVTAPLTTAAAYQSMKYPGGLAYPPTQQDFSHEGYDSPKKYATEGTPLEYSRATSLSNLTIDDHDSLNESPDKTLKNDSSNLSDLDLSDNGDEEDLLSQVINAGMPKSQKKQSTHHQQKITDNKPTGDSSRKTDVFDTDNNSFGFQHLQAATNYANGTKNNTQNSTQGMQQQKPNKLPNNNAAFSALPAYNTQHHHSDGDTVRTYAVEGTPLEFSRATSLSDLTDIHDLDSDLKTIDERKDVPQADKQHVHHNIMHQPPPNQHHNHMPEKNFKPNINNEINYHEDDAIKTYAVEDTPYNFSRRTSFSELSIDKDDLKEEQDDSLSTTDSTTQNITVYQNKMYTPGTQSALDSPKVYCEEGTPLNFSRNDSLSDLSSDEELEGLCKKSTTSSRASSVGKKHRTPNKTQQHQTVRKAGIQSPAITRLKTPSKTLRYQPSMHSTPAPKAFMGVSPQAANHQDQTTMFAVEDTPDCYSRNSSLSSLDSNDHEGLANQSGESGGSDPAIGAKDSPAKKEDSSSNFSRQDSLSSLSVESLSFEPNEMESALLEECISSAMPKSNKVKKSKDSHQHASNSSRVLSTSPAVMSTPIPHPMDANVIIQHQKNLEGPQAETDNITDTQVVENSQPVREKVQEEIQNSQEVKTENTQVEKGNTRARKEDIQVEKEDTTEKDISDDSASCTTENDPDDGSADADRLAQTFAELETQFADLGMTSNVIVTGNATPSGDLCLEAEKNNTENIPESIMHLSTDSLDLASSKDSENKVMDQSEKSTDSLDMSSSKLSLGREARNVIDVIHLERETAPSDKSTDSLDLNSSKPFESGESDIADIMKESFPDMTSSLISNITTPDRECPNILGELATLEEVDPAGYTGNTHDNTGNITAIFRDSVGNDTVTEEQDSMFSDNSPEASFDITTEEEKLLEENANIVLSELSNMVGSQISTGDDDAFIENEQLSLVCSSGLTDTGSDVSMTGSVVTPRQIIVSESITEDGDSIATTIIHADSCQDIEDEQYEEEIVEIMKPRPRIVKPSDKGKSKEEDNTPKGIRGGKKAIKGRPPPANASRNSPPSWKTPNQKPVTVKKTPDKVGSNWMKKVVTKTPLRPGVATSKQGNISPRQGNTSPRQGNTSPRQGNTSPRPGNISPRQLNGPVSQKSGLTKPTVTTTKQGNISPRSVSSSPQRKTGISPRSSPAFLGKPAVTKPSPLAQTSRTNNTASPKIAQRNVATVKPSPPRQQQSKIATPQSRSPKPSGLPKPGSGLPKPGQSRLRQPQTSANNQAVPNTNVKNSDAMDEERPKMPIKQGTFVKDEPSQHMLSTFDQNQNNNNLVDEKPCVSPPRVSELKTKSEEKSKPISKVPLPKEKKPKIIEARPNKVLSPGNRSDHGDFTVAEFTGAWEGSNFMVCDFSGAWQEARLRHKSGGSGSGSCGETPPTQRRSIVIDDSFDSETGVRRRSYIIDDSFDSSNTGSGGEASTENVFDAAQNSVTPSVTNKNIKTAVFDNKPTLQTPKPVASRLPQSRLPCPGSKIGESPKSGSNASLNRSASSSSSSSARGITKPKPVTPPRASSLVKNATASVRSSTPPGRSSSAPGRSITPPNKTKNTADNYNSRSSTPQSRKSSIASVGSVSNRPITPPKQPTKKGTSSKIAGLWKKDKKDTKKAKTDKQNGSVKKESKSGKKNNAKCTESLAPEEAAGGLKRSGTYDKLVIMAGAPDIDLGGEDDDATKMPPPTSAPPTSKSLWRRTYTISDDQQKNGEIVSVDIAMSQEEISDAMMDSAQSSQDEFGSTGSMTTKKSKRRSLFGSKNKGDSSEVKKEKSEGSKKRFSLFRKDSSDKAESKIPGRKGKSGIWLKRKSDTENDMNSPNGDPVIEIPKDKDSIQQQNGEVVHSNTNKPNAAIVQPFNYKPNHLPVVPVHEMTNGVKIVTSQENGEENANKERKMTKTEMLMARRRKSNNKTSGSEASLDDQDSKKGSSSYLVTTV